MQKSRFLILLALSVMLAGACGNDNTTGRNVVLHTQVRADPEISGSFVSETGWSIKLSKAVLSVGSLYYFDGEPAFVMRQAPSLWKRLARWSGPSIAHAHPGHYLAGMANGQMTTPTFVDLLLGASAMPDGNGVTGLYRSARFKLSAPTSEPAATPLSGQVALVEGIATKAAQTVYFRLSASFADVAHSVSGGEVDGCQFDETEVESDGTVTLTIKPHIWFNLVDFAGVAPGTATAPTTIAAGETPQIAFALGVVQLSAYHFSYTP